MSSDKIGIGENVKIKVVRKEDKDDKRKGRTERSHEDMDRED